MSSDEITSPPPRLSVALRELRKGFGKGAGPPRATRELRRFVPWPLADRIERGERIDLGELEVAVLVADLRGCTDAAGAPPHPHTHPEVLGAAVEDVDRLNNVERAVAAGAAAGTWKVRVDAHRLLTANGANGPQPFSLASSHALRSCDPEPHDGQDGPRSQLPQPSKPYLVQ